MRKLPFQRGDLQVRYVGNGAGAVCCQGSQSAHSKMADFAAAMWSHSLGGKQVRQPLSYGETSLGELLVVSGIKWGQDERANYSEALGNATSLAISNAYYTDSRSVGQNLLRYGLHLGFDAVSNILKSFRLDLKRRLPGRIAAH